MQVLAGTMDSAAKGGDQYFWTNEVLCRRCPQKYPQSTEEETQVVVAAVFRANLLLSAHVGRFAGHCRISKTFHRLARCFFWTWMKSDVR